MRDTGQLRRDLADFTDDQFEQFITSLVRLKHPGQKVERLAAPDGGADVLVWNADGTVGLVYQVKHYPNAIGWDKCEESLTRATETWHPQRVVFGFPRNLSAPLVKAFRAKLQDPSDITVDRYTLSDIADDLDAFPTVFERYFPDRLNTPQDLVRDIMLAVQQGNQPLQSGKDLVDRAMGLSEHLDASDPSFEYAVSAGVAGRTGSFESSAQAPYMVATVEVDGHRVQLAAWVRPEVDLPDASWTFTEDGDGEAARYDLYEAFAQDQPVVLSRGVVMRVPVPLRMRDLIEEMGPGTDESQLSVAPAAGLDRVSLSLQAASGTRQEFVMRQVMPKPGDDLAWVGFTAGLLIYVGHRLDPEALTVVIVISPTYRASPDAARNASASGFMAELVGGESVTVESPLVLDGRGEISLADSDMARRMAILHLFFSAVDQIQQATGKTFEIPAPLTHADVEPVVSLAEAMRRGSGEGTADIALPATIPDDQLQSFMDQQLAMKKVRFPLRRPVLGEDVDLGVVEAEFESISVDVVPPLVVSPLTRVVVRGQGAMKFRFLSEDEVVEGRRVPDGKLWTPLSGSS